jgi:hypothetical protein
MNINRNNYEEYFILYLDNELSSEDRSEVEAFSQENPDLKAELDMLLQSKLMPDADITYANKELLMIRNSSSISIANHEEWLLSYIDNELTEEERKDVEKFVAANPAVQTELNLLQQVKLQPEAIVFPDKESLYHKEERPRVVAIRWWRMAAAAVLLLGISTTAVVLVNNKKDNGTGVMVNISPEEKNSKVIDPIKQPVNESPVKNQVASIIDEKKEPGIKVSGNEITVKQSDINKSEEPKKQVIPFKNVPLIAEQKQRDNDLPQPEINPYVKGSDAIVSNNDSHPLLTNDKGISNSTDVTTPPANTYNSTNEADKQDKDTDFVFASEKSGNKGLRGFFRKVTRTFEKRTNIKATDDDDRLLIAGLAIKMN